MHELMKILAHVGHLAFSNGHMTCQCGVNAANERPHSQFRVIVPTVAPHFGQASVLPSSRDSAISLSDTKKGKV